MNEKRFSIFSSWDPRPETPAGLGLRMLKNLDLLSRISPYFKDWWFMDHSLNVEDMLDEDDDVIEEKLRESLRPLTTMRGRMTEMVELGVRRGDFGEPEPNGGYTITADNSIDASPHYVSLQAHGGGIVDPRAGYRSAVLETAADPDPAIIAYPLFKEVLKSLVAAWDVRHAQAYSGMLEKLWNEPSKLFLDLAWMTYLSPELAEEVTPPSDVLVEHMDGGGLLLIAAEETFDTDNPKHVAAARSILKALEDVNAVHEEDCERLWPSR
jgi:hypothetical protein